jgi:molecular chaperone GrpE
MEKLKQLEEELAEKTKLAEDRLNQIRYLHADFDNYRKNFEREKEAIVKLANENLIKELLVILDEFELAINSMGSEKNKEGLSMLYRNFCRVLEKHGLKQIKALGEKFDPSLHEALMKEPSEREDGIILREIQKGFMLNSKVIRPSRVIISEKINDGGEEHD